MDHSSLRFLFGALVEVSVLYHRFVADLQAAFFRAPRAAFVPSEESKVVSSHRLMLNPRQAVRAIIFSLLLAMFSVASASLAFGQSDFTLTATQLQPPEVEPGESATASINLQPVDPLSESPVALTCAITSNQTTSDLPQCVVSPDSTTPPAAPSLTITTTGATPAGLFTITVTGTSGSFTHTVPLNLNVVPATADYTLTVTKTMDPGTVPAGNGAQGTIAVTPIGSYSGHQVTLSCLSVSPLVTAAPICSFNPTSVSVTSGTPPTSVLTIQTIGVGTTTTRLWRPRLFYALWLAVPGLALVGAGATGNRRKNALGLLLLFTVAGGLLLMPACNATTTNAPSGEPSSEATPKGTYTFTLSAVDETGAAPSNTTSNEATVTLTVTPAP